MRRTRGYHFFPDGGAEFDSARLFADPLDMEIDICLSVLKHVPDEVQALATLGDLYTRRGLYEEGLEIDRKLCLLRPTDSTAHYNLACSLALLEEKAEALEVLNKAVDLGYADYRHLKSDSDLDSIRGEKRFALIEKKLLARAKSARAKK